MLTVMMMLRQRGLATGPAAIQTQNESMKNATDCETKDGTAVAYGIDKMENVWRRTSGNDRQEGDTRLYGTEGQNSEMEMIPACMKLAAVARKVKKKSRNARGLSKRASKTIKQKTYVWSRFFQ